MEIISETDYGFQAEKFTPNLFVDITDTFAIVESISNTLTDDMFVSAHVAYGDITFDGYINFANQCSHLLEKFD